MKTNRILLAVFVIFAINTLAKANDEKYLEAMQRNIKAIYQAADVPAYQNAINSFERIASAEKTKWEPFYYIGFGYLMMANAESDMGKKDVFLDKSLEAIERGKAIASAEAELISLEGFAYMLKVAVDPQSRGMVFAPKAMQTFEKALALNPENPRTLALKAQMEFGSAKFFNSPVTEACAENRKALEMFDTYKSTNPLAPVWGKQMAESLAEACK
jgi:tetratricopeptide (TPR) repeat protein